jgi:sugar diacid utilization regulator
VHPYEALAARGYSSHWRVRGGIEVGLVPLVAGTVSDLAHALRSSLHAPAALSPEAPGLAHVDRAGQLAETALRTLGPHADVVSFADRLPEVLLVTQPAVAEVLREQLLGPVLQLPTPERKALLATLKATVVEGKTSSAAARSLFCHRNTVLHRLDRVVELTGHRLDDPRSKLLMHLALLSQSLRDDVSSTKS